MSVGNTRRISEFHSMKLWTDCQSFIRLFHDTLGVHRFQIP